MALPQQDSADAELRDGTTEERASSSSSEEARERAGAKRQADGAAATPPPRQQMDRHSSSSSSSSDEDEAAGAPGRIPAEVFERDDHPAAEEEGNKNWSMMSTDSVFGLIQAAPSGDFTGFVLAHPELMDFDSTPARASTANSDADATVLVPPFESIPELPEATMNGNQSFAFPNLIEDKRHSSPKKVQDEQPPATTTEAVPDEPAPAQAEDQQTSSEPEAAQDNEAAAVAKGGLFACFPCCS